MLKAFRVVLAVAALALCLCTLMPLVRTSAWWVRVFDFPRVQIAILMLVVLLAMGAVFLWGRRRRKKPDASRRTKLWSHAYAVVPILLLAALAWQVVRIYPYTALAAHQMEDATFESDAARERADTVRLLIYNVRYDNRAVAELLETIDATDPDVILLVEPTNWWHEQLAELEADYPHTILQPQDNHYGVLLYSKLELIDPSVRYLVDDEVPSVHARLRLPSGRVATLYGLHPKPPGLKRPADADRQDSDQRDAELLIVAKEVAELVKDDDGDGADGSSGGRRPSSSPATSTTSRGRTPPACSSASAACSTRASAAACTTPTTPRAASCASPSTTSSPASTSA